MIFNCSCYRIRPTETQEERHERKYDGCSFHGTKEKVKTVSHEVFYVRNKIACVGLYS